MPNIGSRARGTAKGAASKFKSKIGGKPATDGMAKGKKPASAGAGPAWKPAKSSVTGNYGKAVSAAAKAKNDAPASAPPRSSSPVPPREGGPSRGTTINKPAPSVAAPSAKSLTVTKPPTKGTRAVARRR